MFNIDNNKTNYWAPNQQDSFKNMQNNNLN